MLIGILSLQGAFREHRQILESLDVDTRYIRFKEDLVGIDGLILPGGESTVMMKLLKAFDLLDALKEKIEDGLPTWGTCAGMILLSKGYLDVGHFEVLRNAFGTQINSFECTQRVGDIVDFPLRFIRAPIITGISDDTSVLSKVNDQIVAVKDRHILATSFHPELTQDTRFHEMFLHLVASMK